MDSLTQMILGASVGAAVMGKRYGRKAALVGAICGTIPDLDVFIPMGDPVSDMTYHRGFSHSILFAILATPLLVWVLSKIKWFEFVCDKRTHLGVFLALVTHPLLDAMTIYGTQIFWPLPVAPIGVGSIFIVDPLYTLPFLGFLIWFLINKSQRAIRMGLIISTAYLGWSAMIQNCVYDMASAQVESDRILVQPTLLNTILWRVLVIKEGAYKVGYYSLFDKTTDIQFGVQSHEMVHQRISRRSPRG
jgi:inner membrane protein